VPLEPKGSGIQAVKAAGRLLQRWGPGHYIRIVRRYYETSFSDYELNLRQGFPSISHLEATDNIVNGKEPDIVPHGIVDTPPPGCANPRGDFMPAGAPKMHMAEEPKREGES